MLATSSEYSLLGRDTAVVTFTADGEHLLSGGYEGVRVLRVRDGKRVATMEAWHVCCIAASNNGKWIAAGTFGDNFFVWNAKTFEQVFTHESPSWRKNSGRGVCDFSPDSTRLVTSSAEEGGAAIWGIPDGRRGLTLQHDSGGVLKAAKYSRARGDRIATAAASEAYILVWDSNSGARLANINVDITPQWNNSGLLWCNNHIFVVSDDTIKEIDVASASTVSQWPAPESNTTSCIALPQGGKSIVYATQRTVTFWGTEWAHSKLNRIRIPEDVHSIALSPDGRLLAIAGEYGKITIQQLSYILEPDILIDQTALDLWKDDQLVDAEALLGVAVSQSQNITHHVLAGRALIRTRLQQWDAAIVDAEQSLQLESSVIGYIASLIALVGKGKKDQGYHICDTALELFESTHTSIFLLIRAVVMFMDGDHEDAISHIDKLISDVFFNSALYVVQAYMYLLLGNSHLEGGNYPRAIQSFKEARAKLGKRTTEPPLVVSLISGWRFDNLATMIQQYLCEALYAQGHTIEASERLLRMVDEEVDVEGPVAVWISDFLQQCLSTSEDSGDARLLRVWAKAKLAIGSWEDALNAAANFCVPRFRTLQIICEHLEIIGHIVDAVECLRQMATVENDIDGEQANWVLGFELRCVEKLVRAADLAAAAQQHDDAITQYSTALLLEPSFLQDILTKRGKGYTAMGLWEDALNDANKVRLMDPSSAWGCETVLTEWAKVETIGGSWRIAFANAGGFKVSRITVYRALCEYLETVDRMTDATECFHEMRGEQEQETGEEADWVPVFQSRFCRKLEKLGDTAMAAQQHDVAVSHYSTALSLNPTSTEGLLIKRSKAYTASGMWKDALNDANEVIMLDPSSPFGYERKYAALLGLGCDGDTLDAFQTMLLKMSESADPDIRDLFGKHTETRDTIRKVIQDAIRDSPRVLINTTSGRLYDKSEQAAAFESIPAFTELISSMTTHIDLARIEREVKDYYRYAMFSHKWEVNEPLFEEVMKIVVYELEASFTYNKLQMFCKIVRDAGIRWAWSDTCCINKADHFVLQEALVSMFKWYLGSVLTIVFLRGVHRLSQRGALTRHIWNTRAWTLQEYHASRVVQFYTEDWTPYLNLDIYNHKESPEIISEMEEATCIPARELTALRPGFDDIREKLYLASRREATFVEDAAYSLLGIFSISMPVVYGERDHALGRLLAQLLTSSGDTKILAWTGSSGSFNSCLPAHITVFSQLPPSHIPLAITDSGVETNTSKLRTSSSVLTSATNLYNRLNDLPIPFFVGQRMKLPCITFRLGRVSASQNKSERVFRAQTTALGVVVIKTEEELSRFDNLYLIHPWVDFLLDRHPIGNITDTKREESMDHRTSVLSDLTSLPDLSNTTSTPLQARAARLVARLGRRPFGGRLSISQDTASLRPPSSVSPMEKQMQVNRFIARLRQPFGAMLFTPTRQHVDEYKRVAAESLITVQVEEITPVILDKLIHSVRMLDVL